MQLTTQEHRVIAKALCALYQNIQTGLSYKKSCAHEVEELRKLRNRFLQAIETEEE